MSSPPIFGSDFAYRVPPAILALAAVLVQLQALRDLFAHGQRGVERGHGVLKYHPHLAAADVPHDGLGRGHDVDVPLVGEDVLADAARILVGELGGDLLVFESDVAGDDFARFVDELHRRERGDALSGPGLADESDGFALAYVQFEVVHRLDSPPFGVELRFQIRDGQ